MPDKDKIDTDWEEDELDLIVADYFNMLAADLSNQPYVKSKHNAALVLQIGRTHGSVEFKHQNISAVLDSLGMPWIPGYKPRRNYQNAIIAAIDRFLTNHPDSLDYKALLHTVPPSPSDVFVAAPPIGLADIQMSEILRRLVRKFDPVERDRRNRELGKAGEEFVFDIEQRRLAERGRSDLAKKVRWVALVEGDGAGYDIRSFELSGRERLLEVKTTNGSAITPFFLTRNECGLAKERPTDWCIYRVHDFAKGPKIFTLSPPLEQSLHLRAETWRASF